MKPNSYDKSDRPGADSIDPKVSARMTRIRGRDTRPEVALRKELRALRLGYRLHKRPIPSYRRTGDVLFPGAKVVVMVDGCFWHRCPEHYRPATQRAAFWDQKINENVERDRQTDRFLSERGWLVIRVWEHEVPSVAAQRIAEMVQMRRRRSRASEGHPA
ncbi:very short patch repair endonuclease [Pseudarthrobacter sp. NKDBFgelt]|uniref:very short patch repair endonuclease n=1 Tax=Pseudarthrobacter sp. NKDBFgelt TaxID=3384443 RepID=UPI0038D35ECA